MFRFASFTPDSGYSHYSRNNIFRVGMTISTTTTFAEFQNFSESLYLRFRFIVLVFQDISSIYEFESLQISKDFLV